MSKYKRDLERLIEKGELLLIAIQYECFPNGVKKAPGENAEELIRNLPRFRDEYQTWYSEAKVVIKQLLPDRLDDFIRYYETPKSRKEINHESYRIEDYLQGLTVADGSRKEIIVGPDAAIPLFQQQLAILKSVLTRFESTLFDLRQLVQADLFDSELEAARELLRHNFLRAAGTLAGVVLEKHLAQVINNHNIKIRKKHPTIGDLNNLLKSEEIIDVPQWRQIQWFSDIRNLCAHGKNREPTKKEVQELIDGVEKIIKTLF